MTPRTPALPGPLPAWSEIRRFRPLWWSLTLRNLKVKYQRSILGFVWTLLNPLCTVGILVVVFGLVVRLPVPAYWAFLLSGYFVWNFVLQMLTSATWVMVEHANLRRSVAFPNEVLILGATTARLVEYLVETGVALALLAIFRHQGIPASFALLPLLIVLQVVMTLGLAFPLSVLALHYSDLQHAVPVATMMLFYLSPVFYPVGLVPESFRAAYLLNPFAGLLTLFHNTLYEGRMPSAGLLLGVTLGALLMLGLGYAVFARYRPYLAEIA